MNHGFQDFQLTPDQKLWMHNVYDSGDFNIDRTRQKLSGQIANDFDPNDIDTRVYKRNHLTLIGIFHVDPKSPVFGNVQDIMTEISTRMKRDNGFDSITSQELSDRLGISVENIEHAVYFLSEMGTYFDGVYRHSADAGSLMMNFKTDPVRKKYLNFLNLGGVMESFFQSKNIQTIQDNVNNTADDASVTGDVSKTPVVQGLFAHIPQTIWDVLTFVSCGIIGYFIF